jgi:glycosyltransferase involved in cell wall biosynthesis
MGGMPGVSFIVTIYNKRPYLPAVLRGLAAQHGLAQAEFLFIDDGSTDGSLGALEAALATPEFAPIAAASRIIAQENRGPAHATNRGIDLATQPWIKLVDGDDRLLAGATAGLLRAAASADAELVIGGLLEGDEAADLGVEESPPMAIDEPLMRLARRMDFNPSALLIATDLARRVGGCDTRVFVQDYSLMLRAARTARFARVTWPVAVLPARATGRISADPAQILHDLNAACLWFLADHPETDRAVRSLMARRAAGRAWHWVHRHRGVGFWSPEFRRHMLSYGAIGDPSATIAASCASFRARAKIRVPD